MLLFRLLVRRSCDSLWCTRIRLQRRNVGVHSKSLNVRKLGQWQSGSLSEVWPMLDTQCLHCPGQGWEGALHWKERQRATPEKRLLGRTVAAGWPPTWSWDHLLRTSPLPSFHGRWQWSQSGREGWGRSAWHRLRHLCCWHRRQSVCR